VFLLNLNYTRILTASSYDAPMLRELPTLPITTFFRSLIAKSTYDRENELFYGYARQALEDGFRLLGLQEGDVILYPDYICDVTLAPCHQLQLKVRYYPVDNCFQPKWDVMDKLIEKKVRAILTVNYFGFPQDMCRWRQFSDKHKIWWIEDNAHGYGSRYNGQWLGTFGDIAIDSMRKVLPVIRGATLHINNQKLRKVRRLDGFKKSNLESNISMEDIKRYAVWGISWLKLSIAPKRSSDEFEKMPPIGEFDYRPHVMDELSGKVLLDMSEKMIEFVSVRRAIYSSWEEFTISRGLVPAFSRLPEGVSPMSYPAFAESLEERQRWLKWGEEHKIRIVT